MKTLIESLKRLYESGRITKQQLKKRVISQTITEDEYKYITGESYK